MSLMSVVMEQFPFICRTKALVLELLAAICLVKGGHEIILSAFDNFKEVCHETRRFHTLMDYFINYQVFHLDFMVTTCNIILQNLLTSTSFVILTYWYRRSEDNSQQ